MLDRDDATLVGLYFLACLALLVSLLVVGVSIGLAAGLAVRVFQTVAFGY